jgi:amidohydrolase
MTPSDPTSGRPGPLPGLAPLLAPALGFYLDLHRYPELSGQEERTAERFAGWLAADGYRVERGVGGHGVVGELRNGAGPVVLLRAELDALPVREDTGVPYASTATARTADGRTVPVSHACGHDAHLACLAGAASWLARAAHRWRGTLLVVGQPAEETLSGARALLADGLYERFGPPEAVLAQHTAPFPAGMVAHADGPVAAGSVTLEAVVSGGGTHASTPHRAADPVLIAAAAVLRLQAVVARETAPAEQLVLTVGSLEAGSAGNVVPDRAVLRVTARAFAPHLLDRAAAAVERVVRAEASASAAPAEVTVEEVSRSMPTVPDPDLTERVRAAHRALFGPARVSGWQPMFATEDLPLLGGDGAALHGHPGIRTGYWMLGSVGPEEWAAAPGGAAEKLSSLPQNHAPRYLPHPRLTLETGIAALATGALAALGAGERTG